MRKVILLLGKFHTKTKYMGTEWPDAEWEYVCRNALIVFTVFV